MGDRRVYDGQGIGTMKSGRKKRRYTEITEDAEIAEKRRTAEGRRLLVRGNGRLVPLTMRGRGTSVKGDAEWCASRMICADGRVS